MASLCAGALVFSYLAMQFLSSHRKLAALPLLLLLVPLNQVPLDLIRNLIARSGESPVAGVFVTKIGPEHTYGVFFNKSTKVRYILKTEESQPAVYDVDTTGLGTGSMPPQYSGASIWRLKLVKLIVRE